jgi:adenosylmethionine-8-amino-7-oxononanoate aminotransferase
LHEKLRKEIATHPNVGAVAGIGMLAGVEFVESRAGKKPFDRKKKMVESFVNKAFENGLILWPNMGHADGVNGDLVMIGPPLISTHAEIDELVDLLKKTIHAELS